MVMSLASLMLFWKYFLDTILISALFQSIEVKDNVSDGFLLQLSFSPLLWQGGP